MLLVCAPLCVALSPPYGGPGFPCASRSFLWGAGLWLAPCEARRFAPVLVFLLAASAARCFAPAGSGAPSRASCALCLSLPLLQPLWLPASPCLSASLCLSLSLSLCLCLAGSLALSVSLAGSLAASLALPCSSCPSRASACEAVKSLPRHRRGCIGIPYHFKRLRRDPVCSPSKGSKLYWISRGWPPRRARLR